MVSMYCYFLEFAILECFYAIPLPKGSKLFVFKYRFLIAVTGILKTGIFKDINRFIEK